MSVLIKLDLGSEEWVFSVNPESPHPDIQIGFLENGLPEVLFDHLSFGFNLIANGLKVKDFFYPQGDSVFVESNQEYLVNERLYLNHGDNALLELWAENAGKQYSSSLNFEISLPPSPFDSWVWTGIEWEPPSPKPDQENNWAWNEENAEWVILDFFVDPLDLSDIQSIIGHT